MQAVRLGSTRPSVCHSRVQKCKSHIALPRRPSVAVRAERSSDGFVTGFVFGGVVFGVLGFVFAPQISKALIGDDQRLKLPRFLEEEKDPAATKQELIDKIANLNASIDDVAAQLKASKQPVGAAGEQPNTITTDLKKMLQL